MQLNLDGKVADKATHYEAGSESGESEFSLNRFNQDTCDPETCDPEATEATAATEATDSKEGEAAVLACTEAARGLKFKPYDMCNARRTLDELANAQQTGAEDQTP